MIGKPIYFSNQSSQLDLWKNSVLIEKKRWYVLTIVLKRETSARILIRKADDMIGILKEFQSELQTAKQMTIIHTREMNFCKNSYSRSCQKQMAAEFFQNSNRNSGRQSRWLRQIFKNIFRSISNCSRFYIIIRAVGTFCAQAALRSLQNRNPAGNSSLLQYS